MKKINLLLLTLLIGTSNLFGQAGSDLPMMFFNFEKNKLPETLLSEKSIVFYMLEPQSPNSSISDDQEKQLKEIHENFKSIGVNVTNYVSIAGPRTNEKSSETEKIMKESGAVNFIAINLSEMDMGTKIHITYNILVTKFNGKENFFDNDQDAFVDGATDLKSVLSSFKTKCEMAKLLKKEQVISENPNIFKSTSKGNKFNEFPKDIKTAGVVFYEFSEMKLPDTPPTGKMNLMVYNATKNSNKMVPDENKKIVKILSKFDGKYSISKINDDVSKTGAKYMALTFTTKSPRDKRYYLRSNTISGGTTGEWKTKNSQVDLIYFYIKDIATGDTYFVDYGDEYNLYSKSLEGLLKAIK